MIFSQNTRMIIGSFIFLFFFGAGPAAYGSPSDADQAKELFIKGIGIESDVPGFNYRFPKEVDPSFFHYYNQYYYKFPVFRGENGVGKVPGTFAVEYPPHPLVLERQSLDRFIDVIGMEGDFLEELLGMNIAYIGVFAFRNEVEKFEPIPFQVDEMTDDGRWVLDKGPKANPEDGNGLLDRQDVLSFYARDAGDHVAPEAWAKGYDHALELKIVDPLSQKTGWVYLLSFPVPAERSPIRYVLYKGGKPDYIWTLGFSQLEWFEAIYKNGYSGWAWGGGAIDSLDTLIGGYCFEMFFGRVKFCLGAHKAVTEIPTYRLGPVLLHRRIYSHMPLGMGLKSPTLVSDGWYGDGYCHAPMIVKIPFKLDSVFTSVKLEVGTDYNRLAYGSQARTSTNPAGFLIDGCMSPAEKKIVTEINEPNREWRLFIGPGGTMLARNMHDPGMIDTASFSLSYIDDKSFPKAAYEGHQGRVGFTSQLWDLTNVPKGTYISYTEYYSIPFYKNGDEQAYLNIFDHPLELHLKDRVRKNKTNRKPPVAR